MPSWEDELATLDAPSWEDELRSLDDDVPQVGDELGLLPAVAADEARFKPWTQPGDAGSPLETSGSNSAGSPLWSGDSLDTLADFGARASNGMYMGYGDELAGLVGGDDMRDNIRNRMQLAKERSPTASIAGDIAGGGVGTAAMMMLGGPAAASATRALPLAGRIAAGGGLAAEQAALSASGYADDGDRLAAATQAAPIGFALGGAGEAAATGIQGAGALVRDKVAPWLRDQGLLNRAASTGRPMQQLSKEFGGREGVIDAGQFMENNGMTQWSPKKLQSNLDDFSSMRQGDQSYFLEGLAEEGGAPVNTGRVSDDLFSRAGASEGLAAQNAQQQSGQYLDAASLLDREASNGMMQFPQALKQRQAFDQGAKWNQGPNGDQGLAAVNRDAANGLRDQMGTALDNTAPGLRQRWEPIQSDLSNSIGLSGGDDAALSREFGSAPAAVQLGPMAAAAGAGPVGYTATLAAKTGGRGMMADAFGGGSAALDWLGTQGTEPMMSMARGSAQTGANQTGRLEGEPEATRGYLLPQAAQQMMQQPGALGPYEKQFWDAFNSADSNALSALIVRLSHTDPQFKSQYLPQLQQLTAEQR